VAKLGLIIAAFLLVTKPFMLLQPFYWWPCRSSNFSFVTGGQAVLVYCSLVTGGQAVLVYCSLVTGGQAGLVLTAFLLVAKLFLLLQPSY
jgi:hypothetical protein